MRRHRKSSGDFSNGAMVQTLFRMLSGCSLESLAWLGRGDLVNVNMYIVHDDPIVAYHPGHKELPWPVLLLAGTFSKNTSS